MATYLERYQQGEHTQVWDELVALGEQVREESLFSDAWAVARETMHRVQYNLDEILIPRLQKLGYIFGYSWCPPEELEWSRCHPPLRTPPLPNCEQHLIDFERRAGMIPLSIRAFYSEVGGVNLTGFLSTRPSIEMPDGSSLAFLDAHLPGRDCLGPDPLYIEGPENADFFDAVIELNADADREDERDIDQDISPLRRIFELPIAPDSYHKINVSGGGGYDILYPDAAADAELVGYWQQRTTFINYLRVCCSWAGLPGLKGISFFDPEELEYLWKDQLPF